MSIQPPRAWGRKKTFLLGALSAAIVGTSVGFFAVKTPLPPCCVDPEFPPESPHLELFREARSLIDQGKWVEARAKLLEFQALMPDYPGIGDYLWRVEEAISNLEHLTAAKAALAAKMSRASLEQAQSFNAVDSGAAAWDLVVRDFGQGEISGAMVLAEACAPEVPRCKSGLEDLKEFSSLLKKMADLGPDQLNRLVVLDQQITGAPVPSRATGKVRLRLAKILYKNAAAARARGAWARAMEFALLTLQADPGHRGAAIIREEMKEKAWETYLRASEIAPTDLEKSLQLFRQVMAMTPPDDVTHQKAKRLIEMLQR